MLASVKLTSFLLVGTYVIACIMLRFSYLRCLPKRFLIYACIAAAITILPYMLMTLSLGSPAPSTLGQLAKLIECGECTTRGLAPHSDFIPWLLFFLSQLPNQLSVNETSIIPIAVYFSALLFIAWSNRHTMRDGFSKPLVAMAIASAAATLITLSIHIAFAWQRYVDYGWIFDSLLRYYLSLLGAYAAVSGYALASIASPSKDHHDQTHG